MWCLLPAGELSFSDLNKVMEQEVKEEEPDTEELELGGVEEVKDTPLEGTGMQTGSVCKQGCTIGRDFYVNRNIEKNRK